MSDELMNLILIFIGFGILSSMFGSLIYWIIVWSIEQEKK